MAYQTQELRWEAELYRLKGELLLQASGGGDWEPFYATFYRGTSHLVEAEACFQQALEWPAASRRSRWNSGWR